MPLIKPRTRGKQLVKHRTRLDRENNETLYAYAQFLGESTEYVLNQVIDTVLARDKEFVKWRETHQGSYVPRRKTGCAGRTLDRAALTQVPPRPEKQPRPLSVRRVVFHAAQDRRSARGGCLGDVRWRRSLGTTRVPRFARRCVPRADRRTRTRSAVRPDVRIRHALVHHAVLRRVTVDVADGDRRLSPRAERARPAAPTVPASRAATHSDARSWRKALPDDSWTGGAPEWLTVPQRGLYTGVMILGAVGTGKTSACMYPYVDQLLRWRADDPARKLGGLVLEVKGDFCGQVRSMLRRTGRDADYVEVGLDTGVCYNPLHNELDPYAVAYAVATLLNNLFGRSKEPFWQQAYTDLLKFVILLRRITDGYTTFSEVYRYILDDRQIDRDIRRLKAELAEPPDVLVIRQVDFREHCIQKPWAHWFAEDPDHMAHPYEAGLETFLDARKVTYEVRKPKGRDGPLGSTSSKPSSDGTCTAGVDSMDGSDRRSSKASSCSCRCSTTVRRCIARSVRREVRTPKTRQPENRSRLRRSTRCWRAARCWR